MRYTLGLLLKYFMLAVSVVWNIQHFMKVSAHGWSAALGLNDATTVYVLATFLGLLLVYFLQIRLAAAVFAGTRRWLNRRRFL